MVNRVANLEGCDLDGKRSGFSIKSYDGRKRKSLVVVDMTSIARCAFGASADPHANGDLFVGSVTAPVGFSTHTTSTVTGNPPEAADREVGDY